MNTSNTCNNEKFHINHLSQENTSNHSVITGLGITTACVTDRDILEGIRKAFENVVVEAEFSYIRNKHLHFTPKMRNGVYSDGHLTIRVNDEIFQFNVIPMDREQLFIVSTHASDCEFAITNVNERLSESEKSDFIGFLVLQIKGSL